MLEPIGRGTTPVISFKFNNVNVDDIVVAFFTLRQGKTTIEKDLTQAAKAENMLTWELTQADTLSLDVERGVSVQCRYRLSNGKVGKSEIMNTSVSAILKDGEI